MTGAAQFHKLGAGRAANRPWLVTILALGVLSIAVLNLVRTFQALIDWKFLAELLPFTHLYLVLSGLVWSLTWLPLAWGLWRASAWAFRFLPVAAVAYSLYFWLDRLLLQAGAPAPGLVFAAALTALLLGLVLWMLRRPGVRAYFFENTP